MSEHGDKLRIDKWLWYARFFKTRTLAATLCKAGKVRLNGDAITKAHANLRQGDTLTFPKGPHVRVVKVLALGTRRGPAVEAQTLYEDLAPLPVQEPKDKALLDNQPQLKPGQRDEGTGRPTKRDRRAIDRFNDLG